MSGWIQAAIEWIAQHPHWAMALVFVTAMAESIAIIGTVIPGTAILIGVGSVAGIGRLGLWPVILFAILGAIAGDGISYWLGRRYKDRIPLLWPFRLRPGLLASGETFFQSHGAKSVFIGRFVPTVRAIIPMVAGIVGMPPIRFYIANVLSALLWGPAHILPGAAIGLSFGALGIPANRMAEVWIGVAIVLVLGGWLANRFWRRARA